MTAHAANMRRLRDTEPGMDTVSRAEAELYGASCEDCAFWHGWADKTCRRNAPRAADKSGAPVWPVMKRDDWCGEWRSGWNSKVRT